MGKDLRGRELGEGIVQRKDGKYFARFTNRNACTQTYICHQMHRERSESQIFAEDFRTCSVIYHNGYLCTCYR